jgi:putative sigma-54 modulation protein
MQVILEGKHLELTDSLKDFTNDKFRKLARHFDKLTEVHVVLSVEKLDQITHANLHFDGADFFAEARNKDMYTSIEEVVDKLDRQIIKNKEIHSKNR